MWVFGGQGDYEKLNDLWKYNIHFGTWDQVVFSESDIVPLERSGHSMTVYKDYILIFGGIQEVTKELNDLYVFDLSSNKFKMLSGLESSKTHDFISPVVSPT